MPTETDIVKIKELIIRELPTILETDPDFRNVLLSITKDRYADKVRTEDRIDRVLEELRIERERSDRRWRELQEDRKQKWEAQERRWEEHQKEEKKRWEAQERKWEEHQKEEKERWEAQERKWEAQEEKWRELREDRKQRWESQERKWETQEKKWEENQKVINEMLASIRDLNRKHESSIGALGARWGIQSEEAFRNGLKAILEESPDITVERYLDFDYDGKVFGQPEQIEMDVIIRNGMLILCEIKSSVSRSELYAFWRKSYFYEEKHDRKADRLMVISPMVDSKALKAAEKLNIEVYSYADDAGRGVRQTSGS